MNNIEKETGIFRENEKMVGKIADKLEDLDAIMSKTAEEYDLPFSVFIDIIHKIKSGGPMGDIEDFYRYNWYGELDILDFSADKESMDFKFKDTPKEGKRNLRISTVHIPFSLLTDDIEEFAQNMLDEIMRDLMSELLSKHLYLTRRWFRLCQSMNGLEKGSEEYDAAQKNVNRIDSTRIQYDNYIVALGKALGEEEDEEE